MFYEDVLTTLVKEKIRFAVAGGVAMVLYGVVRLTVDLDLIVHLERSNLEKFIAAMRTLGYSPRLPVNGSELLDPGIRKQWKEERSMIVFSFHNPNHPLNIVDVFIEEQLPFEEIERELIWFDAGSYKIPVLSKRHLKHMKRTSNRDQDRADIDMLEKLDDKKENS